MEDMCYGCGHSKTKHDKKGKCTALGCECEEFDDFDDEEDPDDL